MHAGVPVTAKALHGGAQWPALPLGVPLAQSVFGCGVGRAALHAGRPLALSRACCACCGPRWPRPAPSGPSTQKGSPSAQRPSPRPPVLPSKSSGASQRQQAVAPRCTSRLSGRHAGAKRRPLRPPGRHQKGVRLPAACRHRLPPPEGCVGAPSPLPRSPTCQPVPQVEIPEGPQGPPQEEGPPSPEFAFSPPAPPAQRAASPTLMAGPGSPLRASLSNPSEARAAKAAARRRAAAEFVEAQTGLRLPAESDLAFRAALRDGVALCRLLNALRPGAVGKVRGVRASCKACCCHAALLRHDMCCKPCACRSPGKPPNLRTRPCVPAPPAAHRSSTTGRSAAAPRAM